LVDASITHDLLPLSDTSCELLVTRFCAAHEETLDEAIRERIIELSGGNPFFLVELLKHRSELVTEELPITVQSLLEDRLTRLSPIALTVLRAAAVLGLSSTVERLHRIVERRTSDVLMALTELHAAGMLSPIDGGATCRHDTIREAVLDRTPTAAKVLLHRRAARILAREAMSEGGVALLWESVDHCRRAGSRTNEVRFVLLLAHRLLALGLASEAMSALEDIERMQLTARERLSLLRRQAKAARVLRDWPRLCVIVQKWKDCFIEQGRLPAAHSWMELLDYEAQYNNKETFGDLRSSISQCLSSANASPNHRLAAAELAMIRADHEGDEVSAHQVMQAITGLNAESTRARIAWLTTNAIFHASFGDLTKAPGFLEELRAEALTISDPAQRGILLRRACFGIARYGDPLQAQQLLLKCLATFEQLNLETQALFCMEELGNLALWSSDYSDVVKWATRAESIQSATGESFGSAVAYELRTMLAFEADDPAYLPEFKIPGDVSAAITRFKRGRAEVLSMIVAERLMRRDLSNLEPHFGELLEIFRELRNKGTQDQVASVLGATLLTVGEGERAAALLHEYMKNSRREIRSPSRRLTSLVAECARHRSDRNEQTAETVQALA
jgi:hypothetical protein